MQSQRILWSKPDLELWAEYAINVDPLAVLLEYRARLRQAISPSEHALPRREEGQR